MATLTGRAPKDTYKRLLLIDQAGGLTGTPTLIQDGEGTTGPIKISTTGVRFINGVTLDFESGATFDVSNATFTGLDISQDATPQLGGDLDFNGNNATFSALLKFSLDTDISSGNAFELLGAAAGELTASSGVQAFASFQPFINQSGTAGYTGFEIDITETATGSGTNNIVDLKIGGSSKFSIDNAGNVTLSGTVDGRDVAADGATLDTAYQQGKETIFIPATAMKETASSGCSTITQVELTSGRPNLNVLDFDQSTEENAQFTIAFPKRWNEGTVTFQPFFTANSTNTGNCIWGLKAVAVSDNDAIDAVFGTAQTVTKAHSGTANDLDVGSESSAITIAGSPAEGDVVYFNIFRKAADAGDTLTADARLIGIKLHFTTNANTDS